MKHKLIITLGLFGFFFGKAQTCGTCSVVITGTNASSYTVNIGQTLCIDSTARYTGSISLNGGTICNKGSFRPAAFNFQSGTVQNKGTIVFPATFTISSGKNIQSEKKGVLRFPGSLVVSGGSFVNGGISNIQNNFTVTSGTFSNTGIVNCKQLSATIAISNNGIINHD